MLFEVLEQLCPLFIGCFTLFTENTIYCSSLKNFYVTNEPPDINNLIIRGSGKFIALTKNSFVKYPNVTSLEIHNSVNDIEKEAFNGMKKLRRLDLHDNELPVLKDGIFTNLSTTRIAVTFCKVEDIEKHTFDNSGTGVLVLSNNRLTFVKKEVFTNQNFSTVYLGDNKIRHIEDGAFSGMQNLCHLELSNNRISSFDSMKIIGPSRSLKVFDISGNGISEVNREMFNIFPNLEIIHLSRNHIKTLGAQTFADIPNLFILDLSYNYIREIRSNIFTSENQIKHLYLHGNQLSSLAPEVLNNLHHLESISIINNPWHCACQKKILSWMKKNKINSLCEFEEFPKTCLHSTKTECEYGLHQAEPENEYTFKINKLYCRVPDWRYLTYLKGKTMC